MSSSEYATAARAAVAADDMDAFFDAYMRAYEANADRSQMEVWSEILDLVGHLPTEASERLARVCAAAIVGASEHPRHGIGVLELAVARNLSEPMVAMRAAIAADDMAALSDAMMRAYETTAKDVLLWSSALDVVQGLPDETVERLADTCAAAFPAVSERARYGILVLVSTIAPTLPILVEERRGALETLSNQFGRSILWSFDPVLAQAELTSGRALSPEVVAVFRRAACESYPSARVVDVARQCPEPVLNVGEQWADRALELARSSPGWHDLLAFATTATMSGPNAKWIETGRVLLTKVESFEEKVLLLLELVGRPRTLPLVDGLLVEPEPLNSLYDPFNANAVRGLLWLLTLRSPRPTTARVVGGLVETSLRRLTGVGPRNPKVANAGVYALSGLAGDAALAELGRLAATVTYKGTLKLINAALDTKARALGLTRADIEEMAVPTYGLTPVGHAEFVFGDASATLTVDGTGAALRWFAGKPVKSVPAAVKRDHAAELRELTATVKDIGKMLTAQVQRLDRQFLARRIWDYPAWRERYLDHPLVGTIARRLLWTVDGVTCGYADGALRDLADHPISGAVVELWHPLGRSSEEIGAWRDWLERKDIRQPFKQAHREVYVLTDAERRTGDYSNRFAGHILRQHQFHALAAVRGWRNRLLLDADDSVPPPTRELPQWGLRAEYWVEGDRDDRGADTTESGSYLYLCTDQVRFYPIDAPENRANSGFRGGFSSDSGGPAAPLPLSDVPELVFSEVLRDVDLFVGVASVGNDPTWQDGGPRGRFAGYWSDYSFGELSQTAQTRRDLLIRLLPRLAIGHQCTVDGRFLSVRGSRHTYRIHLGSGNVLIAPENRYLCIVPSRRPATPDSFLPFDGDLTLSVILSKALLLANDTKITDPTILSQLS
ncbi:MULTISPECIES: DUF4132 domain-containing protein [unclassified Nocardia]|uniref:DUF4132 domain-containing protein n=1 Tax=unclassified Nocardia TaxID=2637762 RepID=UPI001CE3D246|nr:MULTISPECIES: DUF4132 domain-containing protein [unclassified Nocardia]